MMGETYYLTKRQLDHMRTQSDWHLARRPELKGPYAVPSPAPAAPVVEQVPDSPVADHPGNLMVPEWTPENPRALIARRLAHRAEVPAAVLLAEGASFGFTDKMMQMAKKALGVIAFQQDRAWWWRIP